MDYSTIYKLSDSFLEFVHYIGDFFNSTIGDALSAFGLPSGLLGGFANFTLIDFMLVGGISFIVGYTLAKWAINLF